jgi:biotin carboxyl carrier protein
VILDPQVRPDDSSAHTLTAARSRRRPIWRQRRVLLAGLGVLIVATIAVVVSSPRAAAPAVTATPVPLALVAHGQIKPVQQARVGTLAGGVVQEIDANLGSDVVGQSPVARLTGPAGTEVVTAPFSGSVTNLFAHVGDTLVPGAPIMIVANLRSLQVETADVDEFLVAHVTVGQRVQVTVDALDNATLTGTVTRVALLPEAASTGGQAYPVIIDLGGVPPAVHAGMSVRVTLSD